MIGYFNTSYIRYDYNKFLGNYKEIAGKLPGNTYKIHAHYLRKVLRYISYKFPWNDTLGLSYYYLWYRHQKSFFAYFAISRVRSRVVWLNPSQLNQSPKIVILMMTSSNGTIFRATGHLCGEFTGPRWIRRTKANDAEIWCFLLSAPV